MSKLSGLVNVFTLVLPLVTWWWCWCCLFLWSWMTAILTVVVAVVAVVALWQWQQRRWWRWTIKTGGGGVWWQRQHSTEVTQQPAGAARGWHNKRTRGWSKGRQHNNKLIFCHAATLICSVVICHSAMALPGILVCHPAMAICSICIPLAGGARGNLTA